MYKLEIESKKIGMVWLEKYYEEYNYVISDLIRYLLSKSLYHDNEENQSLNIKDRKIIRILAEYKFTKIMKCYIK